MNWAAVGIYLGGVLTGIAIMCVMSFAMIPFILRWVPKDRPDREGDDDEQG